MDTGPDYSKLAPLLMGVGMTVWTLFCVLIGLAAEPSAFWPIGLWIAPSVGLLVYGLMKL